MPPQSIHPGSNYALRIEKYEISSNSIGSNTVSMFRGSTEKSSERNGYIIGVYLGVSSPYNSKSYRGLGELSPFHSPPFDLNSAPTNPFSRCGKMYPTEHSKTSFFASGVTLELGTMRDILPETLWVTAVRLSSIASGVPLGYLIQGLIHAIEQAIIVAISSLIEDTRFPGMGVDKNEKSSDSTANENMVLLSVVLVLYTWYGQVDNPLPLGLFIRENYSYISRMTRKKAHVLCYRLCVPDSSLNANRSSIEDCLKIYTFEDKDVSSLTVPVKLKIRGDVSSNSSCSTALHGALNDSKLASFWRFRLDGNQSFSQEGLLDYLNGFSLHSRQRIEYLEEPVVSSYNKAHANDFPGIERIIDFLSDLTKELNISIALDETLSEFHRPHLKSPCIVTKKVLGRVALPNDVDRSSSYRIHLVIKPPEMGLRASCIYLKNYRFAVVSSMYESSLAHFQYVLMGAFSDIAWGPLNRDTDTSLLSSRRFHGLDTFPSSWGGSKYATEVFTDPPKTEKSFNTEKILIHNEETPFYSLRVRLCCDDMFELATNF